MLRCKKMLDRELTKCSVLCMYSELHKRNASSQTSQKDSLWDEEEGHIWNLLVKEKNRKWHVNSDGIPQEELSLLFQEKYAQGILGTIHWKWQCKTKEWTQTSCKILSDFDLRFTWSVSWWWRWNCLGLGKHFNMENWQGSNSCSFCKSWEMKWRCCFPKYIACYCRIKLPVIPSLRNYYFIPPLLFIWLEMHTCISLTKVTS